MSSVTSLGRSTSSRNLPAIAQLFEAHVSWKTESHDTRAKLLADNLKIVCACDTKNEQWRCPYKQMYAILVGPHQKLGKQRTKHHRCNHSPKASPTEWVSRATSPTSIRSLSCGSARRIYNRNVVTEITLNRTSTQSLQKMTPIAMDTSASLHSRDCQHFALWGTGTRDDFFEGEFPPKPSLVGIHHSFLSGQHPSVSRY